MRIIDLLLCAALGAAPGVALAQEHKHPAPKIDYSKAAETPFGKAADPRKASRVVRVEMADTMRFTPSEIVVKKGDSVRFEARNTGKVMHEMVLGTLQDLREHADMMKKHPGMEHDEPYMLHVAPGKQGEMGWRFTRAGEFYYGCLVPGHFEAGMVGRIKVTAADPGAPGFTEGEVRKIDKGAGKVTLKHGAIDNLGMPPMTMVFRVPDAAVLASLKEGDKIRFRAEKVGGAYTVTQVVK